MKVLFILSGLGAGGTEIQALDIGRNAKKLNFDLTITYSKKGGELEKDFHNLNIPVYYISRKLPVDPRYFWKLRKLIRKGKFDAIHIHEPILNIYAWLAKTKKNKLFLTLHGFFPDSWKSKLILNFILKKNTINFAVSKGFLRRLGKYLKVEDKKFEVLYNGIDFSKFSFEKGTLKKELNIPEEDILLGMVGAFAQRKDQMTLCKAFRLISHENKKVHLAFIGPPDPKHPEFYNNCLDFKNKNNLTRIHFLGARKDINNILNSLDIFVLSSNRDTFGIALVEAMYLKKPCIASDISPFKEVSENGKSCLLFKKGNENDLKNRINELIEDPSKRNQLIENAHERAKIFSIENHIKNLKSSYLSALNE